MDLAIFKSLGITKPKWILVTASLPSLLSLWLQYFLKNKKGNMNSHVFSTALYDAFILCHIFFNLPLRQLSSNVNFGFEAALIYNIPLST